MSIYLVRHGETNENKAKIVQPANVTLSDLGKAQAGKLAERLAQTDISKILCSDLLRTQQTAEPISQKLNLSPSLEPLLRERNFGDLRGRSYADIGIDFFAPNYHPPKGETWQAFDLRIAQAWQNIMLASNNTSGSLLVISHGLVCRSLVANHLTLGEGVTLMDKWDNTSLTVFEDRSPYRVKLLNDTTHLSIEMTTSSSSAV